LNKKPRFFCDNCGNEVGNEVKNCPYCGRIFASIRCPACGYSGNDRMFKNGCPMCGYSAAPTSSKPAKIGKKKPPKTREYHAAEPLPFWSVALTVIVLLFVILILSSLITK